VPWLAVILLGAACSENSDPTAPAPTTPSGPETGTLRITTSTTGSATDPDGYFVAIDGAAEREIGVDGALTMQGVAAGSRVLLLSGLSPNCRLDGPNPRQVTVPAGGLASIEFEVGCAAPLDGQIVFASRPRGTPGALWRLHRMNLDGTGRTPLGTAQGSFLHSAVSPDGSRIYYDDDAGISVVDADGAFPVRLTHDGFGPAVSPDGEMLAFIHRGELRVMSTGGGKFRTVGLPRELIASEPSWSPDGTRIAFAGWTDHENVGVYAVNIDGTDLRELTGRATSPSWSPDGSRIAFVRWRTNYPGFDDIFTMRPDGTDLQRLTSGNRQHLFVRWSPDGTRLVFNDTAQMIFTVNADGSGLASLSVDGAIEDYAPVYTP
jgi:dipeptidyl aminopeptidase/acylaminoacyl peptidase